MNQLKGLLVAILLVVSPIWPLGTNPLPGDPFLIINKKTNQLAYIDENQVVKVVPAATGQTKDLTPEGLFTITVKATNPYYRKKDIPGGDSRNPLGTRWIGFDAEDTDGRIYGIHGTNNPDSIGKYISQGCIRLHNQEVEALFEDIPLGTKLLVTNSEKTFYELGLEYHALN